LSWRPANRFPATGFTQSGIGRRARLKVVKRIKRCAATNVDPDTGFRDLEVPQALTRHLGHGDCGIYAEVVKGGEIAQGDNIEIT
jgi:uncharacterized protein YcbX